MMHIRIIGLTVALFVLCGTACGVTLFDNGHTTYTIVVDGGASVSERVAAEELQAYLKKISGATFALSNNLQTRGNCIYVGHNPRVSKLTGTKRPDDDDQTYTYKTVGENIVIYGGRRHGTMYGVYSFLENELGVRWYTHEYTKVPCRKKWSVEHLDHTESPAVGYRYVMYFRCADNLEWSGHNKNNFYWDPRDGKYGGMDACLGAHTLAEYVSTEEFFSSRPEYFALRGGKRVAQGQPCLSNPEVLRIVAERVKKKIAANPNYLYYDVSQRDNQLFCECQRCRQIELRYGNSHSGIMLWFVNKVAEDVAKAYPDKKLCTFAYQYTRHAPTGIAPHKNVVVRLCDIECCFAHPLDECPENKSFMDDLRSWSKLTNRIFIWDYVVNFRHYLAPYPNFDVLRRNIQTFVQYGACTVLEQGQRQSIGGEFAELKAWVLAKLLWNPNLDADTLAMQFIADYYGKAAPYVKQYFMLCRQQVKNDTHIYQNGDEKMSVYTDAFVKRSEAILARAQSAAGRDDLVLGRVAHLRAQILYLKMKRNPLRSRVDGTQGAFEDYLRKYKPYVREGLSAEQYLK